MERFKACEKEMKTKAFSKEGLSAQQKLDPKEVAKMEMSHWVSTVEFYVVPSFASLILTHIRFLLLSLRLDGR
jgi:hypothetical protein